MPNLTLSVTDAKWERIKAAFTTMEDGIPVLPTAESMQGWIFRQIGARFCNMSLAEHRLRLSPSSGMNLRKKGGSHAGYSNHPS